MSNKAKRAAVISFSILGAACVSTSASAGEWRFHPERCPDLVEDYRDRVESRRDERVNRGPLDRLEDRLDRRESRRDERVTVCPRSAWVWHGRGKRTAKPAAVVAYYDWRAHRYYRKGRNVAQVRIVIH